MNTGMFPKTLTTARIYLAVALAAVAAAPAQAQAQHDHSSMSVAKPEERRAEVSQDNALVKAVRNATQRYKDVKVADKEGYKLAFGCVSGDEAGAMGMHYVNGDLVASGNIDASRPQIVIYEPQPDGTLELVGADFLVMADQWNATHTTAPELMGQYFHLFTAPNRFGLPSFYTLHVWAWKNNPKGTFTNWHSSVSCDSFNGAKN